MNPDPPKIYGLIGYPVKHSFSPVIQNAAFERLGITAEYRLFPVKPEKLEAFLLEENFIVKDIDGKDVPAKDISGFNITIPHKVKAREILERKFPFDKDAYMVQQELYYVKLSGAINTVKREGDKLKYFNTDAPGFLKALEYDLTFKSKNRKVLLIGCGGAGRAIVAGLSWKDIGIRKIYINDVKVEAIDAAQHHFSQFAHLNNKLEYIPTEKIPEIIQDCDLLVNATPVGMEGEDISVIDKKLLHKNLYVYDVVYYKNKGTQLVRNANSRNIPVKDGLSMLLYQGVYAFSIWRDIELQKVPIDDMKQALNEAVRKS